MVLANVAFVIPAENAFCENVRASAAPVVQSFGDHFFRMSDAVDGGGVDPVHAKFQRAMYCGDRIAVVLVSPGKIPAASSDRPGSVANRRNLQIGIAEPARFHDSSHRVQIQRHIANVVRSLMHSEFYIPSDEKKNELVRRNIWERPMERALELISGEGGVQ